MLNIHSDCVPRWLYNELKAQHEQLLEKYHALKLQGASAPPEPKPGRVVQAGPTPEELAHARMVNDLVDSGAKDLANARGIPLDQAREELERIRSVALNGSFGEPPT